MRTRWTKEQAWDWYNARPWVMGVNYVPAITLHGIELFQEDTHEEVMQSVRREFTLMQDVGINSVRVFLPFNVWYHDREKFFERMDRFLAELDAHGVTMMPVIFNDCVGFRKPDDVTPPRPGGWQHYDIGCHGGQKADNAFSGETRRVAWILWDEPEWRPVLEEYERALIGRYRDDPRIYCWDLWNEPGNSNRHDMSIPYLRRAFEIGRELDPIQPLTAAPWSYPADYGVNPDADVEPIQRVALDESDIVTFHNYECIERVRNVIAGIEREGRPMLNTEWLNRVLDNMVQDNLPLYHEKRIGSYSWGLVAGKSQHFLPWDNLWSNRSLPLQRWQHDLFDTYHTAYDPEELAIMRRLSPKK